MTGKTPGHDTYDTSIQHHPYDASDTLQFYGPTRAHAREVNPPSLETVIGSNR